MIDFAYERRDYYRIEDNAFLDYQIVPPEQLDATLSRFNQGAIDYFSLNRSYIENEKVMADSLARIHADFPVIAAYLDALERKINLLAPLLINKNQDFPTYPTRRINLSGGGIAFDAEQEIAIGVTVEIKLVLFPRYYGILAYGTVVYCAPLEQPQDNFAWRVALNFTHIREIDRDLIIRHVLQQQAAQLRKR